MILVYSTLHITVRKSQEHAICDIEPEPVIFEWSRSRSFFLVEPEPKLEARRALSQKGKTNFFQLSKPETNSFSLPFQYLTGLYMG